MIRAAFYQPMIMGMRWSDKITNDGWSGAVAGSPGTMPTGMSSFVGTGITRNVASVDATTLGVRFSGTASTTASFGVFFASNTAIDAISGQTWRFDIDASISAGSSANITLIRQAIREGTSGGTQVKSNTGSGLSLTGSLQPFSYAIALSGGGTVAKAFPYFECTYSSGAVIDITLLFRSPNFYRTA